MLVGEVGGILAFTKPLTVGELGNGSQFTMASDG